MWSSRCLLVAGVLACNRPDAPPAAEQVVVTDTTLVAKLVTDRASYTRGEAITMTLTVRNASGTAQTLEFSSGQRYDFVIEDTRAPVWRWSASQTFIQMLGQETIAPGDSLVFRERFTGELPAGEYRAEGTLTRMVDALHATARFEVR